MAARNHRLEIIPLFLAYIDEIRTLHKNLPEDRQSAFLYVIHLLAEWREAKAYVPLCEVMRLDEQTIRRVFEDGLHETSWRAIFSVFDGDIDPIVRVINDADAFDFARAAMLQALTAIALQYPETRTAALAVLRNFYDRFHEQDRGKGDIVWNTWANSIIDLGAEDFSPLVRNAFDTGNLADLMMDYEDFLQYLDYTTGKQPAPGNFRWDYDNCAIDDTIEELSSWYCFSEEFIRQETRRKQAAHDPMSQNRFGMNKIGRNAPCPCGSGRKFKKCCLNRPVSAELPVLRLGKHG